MIRPLKCLATATFFLTIFNSPVLAGTGPAILSCKPKSATRAVNLQGIVPGDDGTNLTLIVGAKSLRLNSDNSDTHMVEAFEQKVFTMIVKKRETEEKFSLYAIPKTIKARKSSGSIHAKFDAVLETYNPQGPKYTETFQMSCAYDYEI